MKYSASSGCLSLASPLMTKRDDVLDNMDTFCKSWDLSTPAGAKKLWDDTAAGVSLELFIKTQWEHETHWLKNLENGVAGIDGTSTVDGCSTIGTTCNPLNGKNCTTHYKEYGSYALGKNSYWIFQAVKGLHEKFAQLHTQLNDAALVTSLQIETMISDFEGDEDDASDICTWLSAACGMGSAIGGLVPGAGEGIAFGFDILGGIFDVLSETEAEDGIDSATISNALASIYKNATEKLTDTLWIALGNAENDAQYDTLPAPLADTYETKIAKFFNGGWFLVENDSESVKVVLDTISNNIQAKIANQIMSAADLVLVADTGSDKSTRESCGYATGRQWLKAGDKEYCFYIMRHKNGGFSEADEDIYTAMANYGLGNREMFYNGIIDCAMNGGDDSSVDTANVIWGSVPTCYFNLPTFEVWTSKNGKGCGSAFDNSADCTFQESKSWP